MKKQLGKKGPKVARGERVLSWGAVEIITKWSKVRHFIYENYKQVTLNPEPKSDHKDWYKVMETLETWENRLAIKFGWWVRDFYEIGGTFPLVLECLECRKRPDGYYEFDDPRVYFKFNQETGNYQEAPELYIPMQNPESRTLQEMLANDEPLQKRYDQFVLEQLQEEKAAKKQLPTQMA